MALIGTEEAAKRLGVTARRVVAMIRAGRLPGQMVAGTWILDESEVEKFRKAPRPPGRPRKKRQQK